MALLKILKFPDPRLRHKAKPVVTIDDEIRRIVADMYETMYHARGVGLAATQVGIDLHIFTMDVSPEGNSPICAINSEIISKSGSCYEEEGCLSVSYAFDKVKRYNEVHLRALDLEGKEFELHGKDLMAVCMQHETDHLNGKLFIDHLSRLKFDRIKKKIEKIDQRGGE